MVVKDVFKCQLCNLMFEGSEYIDKEGLRYKMPIHEHKCSEKVFGFGLKVGYKIEESQIKKELEE